MTRFLLSFFILASCGCSSFSKVKSVQIDELNNALVDLQKIVAESLPVGKRKQSQNARSFYSEYFAPKQSEFVAAQDARVRYTAEIEILGDRRPYIIEIRVVAEKRGSGGEYSVAGYSEGLARVISRRIQKALYKRRDGLNIIDDFRVF